MTRGITHRLRKLEKHSTTKPHFFMVGSKGEADACLRWIQKNHPNWLIGSYYVIYDDMSPKDDYVRGPEPPWGWSE